MGPRKVSRAKLGCELTGSFCIFCNLSMVTDILNCRLLNVGGRAYRVVGSASVASHAPVHAVAYKGPVPPVANDEEYDEDDVSAFEVQEESSEYVIRLTYDAEVPHSSSLEHHSQTFC